MSEQKERTPRNTPGGAIFVGCVLALIVAGVIWLFLPPREVQVVATELVIEPYDSIDWDDVLRPASQHVFTPVLDDVLLIDWPFSIFITDTYSTTIVMRGPATVRFSEGE